MSDASSTSDLSARVKTGFPLAAGIAILLFTPALVIGLAVMAVAFIGAQELTSMLSAKDDNSDTDRKSTRLNSSHALISYAVFCLKKKNKKTKQKNMNTSQTNISL